HLHTVFDRHGEVEDVLECSPVENSGKATRESPRNRQIEVDYVGRAFIARGIERMDFGCSKLLEKRLSVAVLLRQQLIDIVSETVTELFEAPFQIGASHEEQLPSNHRRSAEGHSHAPRIQEESRSVEIQPHRSAFRSDYARFFAFVLRDWCSAALE